MNLNRFYSAFLLARLFLFFCFVSLQADPPPDLVLDGVPPIPQALLDTIAPYWASTGHSFMAWEPDTDAMLISSFSQETRQLELLATPGSQKKMSTLFPDQVLAGAFMPKCKNLVVFSADHNGDELNQFYSLDVTTGKTVRLTDGESMNESVVFGHDGYQIAYTSTMRDRKNFDIYIMDPRDWTSSKMLLQVQDPGWILQDWAHDNHHVLTSHLVARNASYLWTLETATGETTLITREPDTQVPFLLARYTPDDDGIYGIALNAQGMPVIRYLPITPHGSVRKIPLTTQPVNNLELSPDGTLLAYMTAQNNLNQLHFFNTVTGQELPTPVLPAGFIAHAQWNQASTKLGFSVGTTSQAAQAYSFTVPTETLDQWTQPGTTVVNPICVQPEQIKIRSFDDLPISGYLYRPDPQKFPGKRPVIISIHGGPQLSYLPEYLGPWNYYLDELGVALFYPNVRGSAGFGKDFADLDNGMKREDSVKDIGAFLDWIGTDAGLDSDRIGVEGGSYGGYMTLATLYHYNNRVRCGSDAMGITNFITFLHNSKPHVLDHHRWEFGDERYPEMNAFLESISPLNHANEIKDPVMITAGKNDPRVPVSESVQMVKAIQAQKGIVWYMMGENEGHGFTHISEARYQFAAEVYFFQTYLLPAQRLTPLGPAAPAQPTPPKPIDTQD